MIGNRVRRVARLAVIVIVIWLLWMTLRPSGDISIPGVRMGSPRSAINLRPFSHKVGAARTLLTSNSPAARRAARIYLTVDVLGNIVVFVPLGIALAMATSPSPSARQRARRFGACWWLRIFATGLLLSLGIELVQLVIPSRATDVDDVLLNTLGTMVGALAAWGLLQLLSDK